MDAIDLRSAVQTAEPAVLAAVVAQLTGDDSWVRDPRLDEARRWRAGESPALSAGGEQFLDEITAAVDTLVQSGPGAPPIQDAESLLDIARSAFGETIDPVFSAKLMHHLRLVPAAVDIDPQAITDRALKVTIVGAGISGLSIAFSLAEAGIDYELLEMSGELGGIWLDNTYPECGVDTQAYQYAFDSEPNLGWSRYDVKRDEILDYIRSTADKRGVTERIRYGTRVSCATHDAVSGRWVLDVERDGRPETTSTDVLIVAVGSLNRPKVPELPGLELFAGDTFHTARWRPDVSLVGKRVAIIGNGSSGVQVMRPVADVADHVVVVQRSPHWIRPRRPSEVGDVSPGKHWLLQNLQNYHGWYRFYLDFVYGDRDHHRMILQDGPGRTPSAANDALRVQLNGYIRDQLNGREDLIAQVTPDFPPYTKRLVVDNGWYDALTRPHVELVSSGVTALDESGFTTSDGRHHEVDVIIWATGFHGTRYFWPLELKDSEGCTLAEHFGADDDLRAYLGVMLDGYPNLFSLQGPNTSIGHGGGATFMSESQGRFVMTALKYLIEQDLSSISIRPDVAHNYNDTIDRLMERMVWTEPGVLSRFHNSKGRVLTNHPFTLVEFFDRTRSPQLKDFSIEPRGGDGA